MDDNLALNLNLLSPPVVERNQLLLSAKAVAQDAQEVLPRSQLLQSLKRGFPDRGKDR